MAWPIGLSWVKGYWTMAEDKNHTREERIYVHGGPFLWLPDFLGFELYVGFRPIPPWLEGGNEGIFPFMKKILMKLNMSNLGFAFRSKK
jgi:hypothetical protein